MFHVQVEAHLDTLVNEQAAMVLNRVGLAEAYRTVQAYQPKQVKLSWKAVIDRLIQNEYCHIDSISAIKWQSLLIISCYGKYECLVKKSSSLIKSQPSNDVKFYLFIVYTRKITTYVGTYF